MSASTITSFAGYLAGMLARAVRRAVIFMFGPDSVFEFPPEYQFVLTEAYAEEFVAHSWIPWSSVKPMVGKWVYFVHVGGHEGHVLLYEVE